MDKMTKLTYRFMLSTSDELFAMDLVTEHLKKYATEEFNCSIKECLDKFCTEEFNSIYGWIMVMGLLPSYESICKWIKK